MKLNVAIIQTKLFWEDKMANLNHFSEMIDQIDDTVDLIALPEMFSTGFTMNATQVAEPLDGPTLEWMANLAAKKGAVLTGSFVVIENGQYFNRLVWMPPDHHFSYYDKRHLFGLANEDQHYTPGNTKIYPEIKGWKVLPLICYDLRFPVWSRNTNTYDLLLYVANWPVKRTEAWKSLLVARAIENQCYTLGVNRVGFDDNEYYYQGDSCIVDYAGQLMAHRAHFEDILQASLDLEKLQHFRNKLPFLKDADAFSIQ